MGLKVTIKDNEIDKFIKNFEQESFKSAKKVFSKAILAADSEVKENATTKIKSRSGTLRKSLNVEETGTTFSTLSASLYSGNVDGKPVVYAPIHEFGGTVKAKDKYKKVPGGPYLNMPMADNLMPSGVARMTARMVFANGGRLLRSKKGNWVVTLGDKLMFLLIKEVTIKPQLGMMDAIDRQVPLVLSELHALIGEE